MPPNATRARLLDCAEQLLAASAYDAVSVRAICSAADANVAAVHYHFGGKEDLVVALLTDRLEPRWVQPLSELADDASIRDVVDAVLSPFQAVQQDPKGRLHLRLLARVIADNPQTPWSGPWTSLTGWAARLPGVGTQSGRRRWALAFDLILTTFGRVGDEPLAPATVAALSDFIIAGLSAPAVEETQ